MSNPNSSTGLIFKGWMPDWVFSPTSKFCQQTIIKLTKILMGKLQNTKSWGENENFLQILLDRSRKRGLITISNHNSTMDDPFMWFCLPKKFRSADYRISTAAKDVVFTKPFHSVTMSLGKVVPINRGGGVYQKTVDYCIDSLNNSKWVQYFPEGKLNTEKITMRIKWGIGRIIADCKEPPIVVPIHHIGIDKILPVHPAGASPWDYVKGLRFRQKVVVYFGKPLDLTEQVEWLKKQNYSPQEQWKYLADIIQEKMAETKAEAEKFYRKAHGEPSC